MLPPWMPGAPSPKKVGEVITGIVQRLTISQASWMNSSVQEYGGVTHATIVLPVSRIISAGCCSTFSGAWTTREPTDGVVGLGFGCASLPVLGLRTVVVAKAAPPPALEPWPLPGPRMFRLLRRSA